MYIFLLLTIIYAYVVIIHIITYCGYLLLFMGRARASHRGAVRPRGRGAVRRWPLRGPRTWGGRASARLMDNNK